MNGESTSELARRVTTFAALGDPVRLRIVDALAASDASSSELMAELGIASNLLAHHLKVLREAGLVSSHRSQGDRRRQYVRLAPEARRLAQMQVPSPSRVVFVCTANSARSQLAAGLWRTASSVPAISAGTHPADRIDPGALRVARRRKLDLPAANPRRLDGVLRDDDLIITVCDLAHEELLSLGGLHWSVPDPVREQTETAYDTAYNELQDRVEALHVGLVA